MLDLAKEKRKRCQVLSGEKRRTVVSASGAATPPRAPLSTRSGEVIPTNVAGTTQGQANEDKAKVEKEKAGTGS